MNGFSDEWLALREPADRRARDPALVEALKNQAGEAPPWRVIDLGAGNGANLRYLMPHLGHDQSWLLVDHDQDLLARVPIRLAQWASGQRARVEHRDGTLHVQAATFSARLERLPLDLARDLGQLPFGQYPLVTGSALLDLAGADWLSALADHCADEACAVYFALSYNGETHWSPTDHRDESMRASFNRHQAQDKGLGFALGPHAAQCLATALQRKGYGLISRASDWVLAEGEQALQLALVDGIAQAVDEIEPLQFERTRRWSALRQRLVREGRSRLRIGHTDLVGIPPRGR